MGLDGRKPAGCRRELPEKGCGASGEGMGSFRRRKGWGIEVELAFSWRKEVRVRRGRETDCERGYGGKGQKSSCP